MSAHLSSHCTAALLLVWVYFGKGADAKIWLGRPAKKGRSIIGGVIREWGGLYGCRLLYGLGYCQPTPVKCCPEAVQALLVITHTVCMTATGIFTSDEKMTCAGRQSQFTEILIDLERIKDMFAQPEPSVCCVTCFG